MQKKHSTVETNVKTDEAVRNQWSATLCGEELLIFKSKRNAEKGEVSMRLDCEDTGVGSQPLRIDLV